MGEYWDRIGSSTGASTSLAALTGSPYSPKKSGRLKKIKIVVSRTANTSIAWAGEVELKCSSFGGVDCTVPFGGIGEAAADIVESGAGMYEHEVDLKVETGVQITASYLYQATPTTPTLYVYGLFEA